MSFPFFSLPLFFGLFFSAFHILWCLYRPLDKEAVTMSSRVWCLIGVLFHARAYIPASQKWRDQYERSDNEGAQGPKSIIDYRGYRMPALCAASDDAKSTKFACQDEAGGKGRISIISIFCPGPSRNEAVLLHT